jgi:hypothetical protein
VAKQGAFEAILPSMPAYVPILIWEIRVKHPDVRSVVSEH